MQWRARVVAPLLAAVLGIGGGVATAVLVDVDEPPPANDPLGLGVPLKNLPCTGQSILVVGFGNSSAPLGNGVADNQPDVRYLETADSCQTLLGPEDAKQPPAYVAYLGPYSTRSAPCGIRMTSKHRTDFVAMLRQGDTELVKCPCELKTSDAPVLSVEMSATANDLVWIRSLQNMLHDYDPQGFPHAEVTGVFTEATRREVLKQQLQAGYLGHSGVVDGYTWQILTKRICAIYTY